jgi:hypothetical protein
VATNSVVTTTTNSIATSLCDFFILLSSLVVIGRLFAAEGADSWEEADSLGEGVGFVWGVALPSAVELVGSLWEEALPLRGAPVRPSWGEALPREE